MWQYNAGYAKILSNKHPQALGRPGVEVWDEVWQLIVPILSKVKEGETVLNTDMRFLLDVCILSGCFVVLCY